MAAISYPIIMPNGQQMSIKDIQKDLFDDEVPYASTKTGTYTCWII